MADAGNGQIRRVSPDGAVNTLAELEDAELEAPADVAVGADGTLYVADARTGRILIVTAPGTRSAAVRTLATLPDARPVGLAVDGAAQVYVADGAGDRIWSVSPGGQVAVLSLGVTISKPADVAVDAAGRLYVSDAGLHRVVRVR